MPQAVGWPPILCESASFPSMLGTGPSGFAEPPPIAETDVFQNKYDPQRIEMQKGRQRARCGRRGAGNQLPRRSEAVDILGVVVQYGQDLVPNRRGDSQNRLRDPCFL